MLAGNFSLFLKSWVTTADETKIVLSFDNTYIWEIGQKIIALTIILSLMLSLCPST